MNNFLKSCAYKASACLALVLGMGVAQAQTCALGANSAASGGSFQLEAFPSEVTVNSSALSTYDTTLSSFALQNVYGVSRATPHARFLRVDGNTSITYTFSPAVPANRIALIVFDVGFNTAGSPPYNPQMTISFAGGANASDFSFSRITDVDFSASLNPLTYNAVTGVISKTSSSAAVRESGALVGNSSDLVTSLTLTTSGLVNGDLVGYGLASIPTCVTTRKVSFGAAGDFSFTNTNLSVASRNLTTTAVNTPVSGTADFVPNPATPVSITEALPTTPAGWRLAKASCSDARSAITGNTGTFGALTGNSISLPANVFHPAANITCEMVNSLLLAADDTQSTVMDVPVSGTASIFSNDTGTNVSLASINGAACSAFPCVRELGNGTLTIDAAGNYSFAPASGFTGVVTIPYQITDDGGLLASANIVITVSPVPKLSLAKSSNGPWVVQQSGAVYSLVVSNNGTATTSGIITVSDSLPNGVSASSGSYAGWNCTVSGQDVACTNSAAIAVGSASTVSLPVTIAAAAVPGVTNNASVGGGGDPYNNGNPPTPGSCAAGDLHCASTTTPVSPQPGIVVLKTNDASSVTQGALVTYTVTISNPGTIAVSGVSWSDNASVGLSDLAISAQTADANGSNFGTCSGLSCTGITLVAGGHVSYKVSAKVTGEPGSTAVNTASVLGGNCTAGAPCTSTDSDPIVPVNVMAVPAGDRVSLVLLALLLMSMAAVRIHTNRKSHSDQR
jgi:uncharacterized repeat protein (TIGR01451 family)